ncbi:MAG: hypothetical protein L0H83_15025 [Salinisphaera sp.]|nr:hypothetical protein [Salinisphaera sp.]
MIARREAEELLPAHVNGSLDPATARALDEVLAEDPDLAAEARFLSALREELQADDASTPGAMGWQRLRRSIAAEGRPQASAAAPTGWWRAAAVAAVAVIAIQGVLLLRVYQPPTPGYIPLAGEARGQIQLRFAPDATAAQIQRLLAENDLVIISGPGASGVYRLRLGGDADAAEVDAMVAYLARRDGVVAFVARE